MAIRTLAPVFAERRGNPPMRLIAIGVGAASTSGLAILLYAAGLVTLPYSITFLAPLTAIVFAALMVAAGRGKEEILLNRLRGGLIAGLAGLLAYDLVRLAILTTHLVPFNPFRPIEVYGLLILDRYQDSLLTKSVGWGFHMWNGVSFACMYTLAVGRGRVLGAFAWAMLLEFAMLATYPSMFRLALDWPFVTISFVGHTAYGLAVGLAAERTVRW